MQGEDKPEVVKRKKLVIPTIDRAALINARSNFVPQTKTVVVHRQQAIVLDSPERATKNRGGLSTSSGLSLAGIGMRHFQQQKERLTAPNASQSKPTSQLSVGERKGSNFLASSQSQSSTVVTSKPFGIGSNTSFSAGTSSRSNSNATVQSGSVSSSITSGMSLSEKFRARSLQKQNATLAPAKVTPSVSHLQSNESSYDVQVQHSTGSEFVTASSHDNVDSAYANESGDNTVDYSMEPANDAATSVRSGFLGNGRSLSVKSVVHAPVKSVKFTSTASYTSSNNAINASSTTAADAIMYGLHNIGAAESIATYLDAVVVPTLSKARPSVATEGKVKASAVDTTGTDARNEAGADDNTDAAKTQGKTDKAEKADSYNNYVRKNLKSGGSSKKLNRTTSRTSMAKQRWMNRNNETGNSGGGKYGKYSKYKKGGGYSGGGNDNDDNNTGSANNNNSYNKPRGLQQWGLDALEMSLNLIEQQQQAIEPDNTDNTIVTADRADSTGMNAASHSVVDENKSADNKGGVVLEDSEGEDDDVELDQANAFEADMVIDQPVQTHSVSLSNNDTAQATAKRSVSTTIANSGQQTTSTSTTATKSHSTTSALAPTYPPLSPSLLSSIHTNRTTKLSKQSAKLHKAELKQARRILDNERVTNMTLCAPKCPGHSMPSKLLVVKKSGANKGKYFYSCTFPSEQRCNFFMWAEDNPELLDKSATGGSKYPALNRLKQLQSNASEQGGEDKAEPADPAAQAAQARLQYTLHHYATKLKTFNSEELKAEVLKIGHRLALAGRRTTKISTTGTKEELQERILIQAMQILNGDTCCDDGEIVCAPVKQAKSRAKATAKPSTKATSKSSAKMTRKAAIQSDSENGMESDESSSGGSGSEKGTRQRNAKTVKAKPTTVTAKSKESAASPSTRSPSATITPAEAPVAESRRTSAPVQAATVTNSAQPTNSKTTSTKSISLSHKDEESLHNSDSEPSIDDSEHSNADSDDAVGSELENDASVNSGVDDGSDGSDNDRIDISDSESILLDAAVEVTIDNNPSSVDYDSDNSSHSQISVNSVDSVDTSSVVSHNSAESESDGSSSDEGSAVNVPTKKRTRVTKTHSLVDKDASSGDVIKTEASKAQVVQQPVYDELESMLRANFGFSTFRPGQRWAMQRCLQGQSSLLVMPTGAGKSLCYMLPAMALPGLTVVVSPLVALMQDQLRKLPLGLTGACLSGSLTAQEMMQISEGVLQGHIKVLYVSPERLCTPSFRRLITLLKQQQQFNRAQSRSTKMYNSTDSSLAALDQPVVSLLCVDEAHCLSQWSYNFRPAFLRIRREVQFIQPAAVLALTATATPRIQHDVMRHLGIPSFDGLMALPVRRDNLQVSVHLIEDEEQRRKLIVELVKEPRIVDPTTAHSEPDHDHNNTPVDATIGAKRGRAAASATTIAKKSVPPLSIVYVWRRFEADSLSEYLKASGVPGVAVYHAGIDAGTRARTQLMFDRGKVRCIVATVAFGMGVDKSDVRQVIHCTMPKSIESYMQEMGRAGRDGQPAACHLLLQQEDAVLQHSLSHSMQLSHIQIASLLLKVFLRNKNTSAKGSTSNTMYNYATQPSLLSDVSLLLDPLEASMDINSTVAETIMSVLELPPYNLLIVDGTHFDVIQGRFRMITENLQTSDILVAALLALNTIKPAEKLFDEANQPKSTNGMNESYGLGYDCSASAANQGFSADDDMYSSTTNTNNTSTKTSSWERDRKLGGSYGGKIQDFQCSRLAIALHTGLNIDEVSTGLYKLQRAGVLEYKLQDSALYLKVLPYTPYSSVHGDSSGQSSVHSGYSSDKCNTVHHFDAYCAQHALTHKNTTTSATTTTNSANQSTTLYYDWIWHLSCCVYTSLQKISSGGSHRISDMWRTGSTIAHYNSGKHKTSQNRGKESATQVSRNGSDKTETTKLSTVDTLAVHEAAQSLLSYVMNDADGETTNTNTDVTMSSDNEETTSGDEMYVQMKDMYLSTPPPFKNLLPTNGTKVDTSSNKLCDRLRNDIQVLQRDPNLLTAVNTLLKQALPILAHQASTDHTSHSNTNTSPTSSSITVQQAKKGLLALSMCRIMHALPTKLLPATAWRDRSDAWGRHKDVDFDQLLAFVVQELH